MRNGGAAPDPSTQFSLFCLYIFEYPTFHSAQDDEMRRGDLKTGLFKEGYDEVMYKNSCKI